MSAHLEARTDVAGAITLAGYRHHLFNEGYTAQHVHLTVSRIRGVFDACGFVYWRNHGAALLIHTRLAEILHQNKRPIGGKTINYYIRAVKAFCSRFTTDAERAGENAAATPTGMSRAGYAPRPRR